MEILLLTAVLGLIPAAIAHSKGRSFFGFWIYRTLLFIVAFPHAILMKRNVAALEAQQLADGAHQTCPYCAEIIEREARGYRFCGRELGNGAAYAGAAPDAPHSGAPVSLRVCAVHAVTLGGESPRATSQQRRRRGEGQWRQREAEAGQVGEATAGDDGRRWVDLEPAPEYNHRLCAANHAGLNQQIAARRMVG
jgi:hypothetical protein